MAESEVLEIWETTQVQPGPELEWEPRNHAQTHAPLLHTHPIGQLGVQVNLGIADTELGQLTGCGLNVLA